jgi:precorrin-6A synthase
MLDEGCAFETLAPDGIHIWWGAYLGMKQEVLAAGPLGRTGSHIATLRARERDRNGWIMDIYLMKKNGSISQ